MTENEKQLLLKDLCARLPYGIIVHLKPDDYQEVTEEIIHISNMTQVEQIKAEIERLIKVNKEYKKDWKYKLSYFNRVLLGRLEALEGLLNFIESLEKE